MNKHYYVYILTNDYNNVFYVGVTSDLEKRIIQHRSKLFDGFTAKYNVNKLVYFESMESVIDAIELEKKLKKWRRDWKIRLIQQNNPMFNDLSILSS